MSEPTNYDQFHSNMDSARMILDMLILISETGNVRKLPDDSLDCISTTVREHLKAAENFAEACLR